MRQHKRTRWMTYAIVGLLTTMSATACGGGDDSSTTNGGGGDGTTSGQNGDGTGTPDNRSQEGLGTVEGVAVLRGLQDHAGIQLQLHDSAGTAVATTSTITSGAYLLLNIEPGQYIISASWGDHTTERVVTQDVTVTANMLATVADLTLTPVGSITGQAKIGGSGRLGTEVFLPGTSYSARTDASGNYVMSGVPVGSYQVCAIAGGFATACVNDVAVAAAASVDAGMINITADAVVDSTTAALEGSVVLAGANAHNGVEIALAGTTIKTTSNADGTYTLIGVPQGQYNITYSAPDNSGWAQGLQIDSFQLISGVATQMPPVSIARGTVVRRLDGFIQNMQPVGDDGVLWRDHSVNQLMYRDLATGDERALGDLWVDRISPQSDVLVRGDNHQLLRVDITDGSTRILVDEANYTRVDREVYAAQYLWFVDITGTNSVIYRVAYDGLSAPEAVYTYSRGNYTGSYRPSPSGRYLLVDDDLNAAGNYGRILVDLNNNSKRWFAADVNLLDFSSDEQTIVYYGEPMTGDTDALVLVNTDGSGSVVHKDPSVTTSPRCGPYVIDAATNRYVYAVYDSNVGRTEVRTALMDESTTHTSHGDLPQSTSCGSVKVVGDQLLLGLFEGNRYDMPAYYSAPIDGSAPLTKLWGVGEDEQFHIDFLYQTDFLSGTKFLIPLRSWPDNRTRLWQIDLFNQANNRVVADTLPLQSAHGLDIHRLGYFNYAQPESGKALFTYAFGAYTHDYVGYNDYLISAPALP